MARVPETGFYFEPVAGRLALFESGTPFPSDEEWAYVGDPRQMTADEARREVAIRWPDADASALEVERPPAAALTSRR